MSTYPLGPATVHRVGFGAMQLPGPGVLGPPRDRDEALAVLRRAVEAGVDHVDTAQFYGPEVANELIREALHPYPEGLTIVSKVGAERDEAGGWLPAQRPDQLRADVEANLRTLEAEQLGVVNLRLMDPGHLAGAGPDQQVPLEDQLAEMAALRDAGKIGGVGISTATIDQVRLAHDSVGLACVQNAFNLLDRSDAEVLEYCADQDVAYVPYFPLGSAFPDSPKVTDDPTVREVARRRGASAAQVGLAWLLAHRPNVLLIPGTSRLAHLEENLGAAGIELGEDDLAALDAAGS